MCLCVFIAHLVSTTYHLFQEKLPWTATNAWPREQMLNIGDATINCGGGGRGVGKEVSFAVVVFVFQNQI